MESSLMFENGPVNELNEDRMVSDFKGHIEAAHNLSSENDDGHNIDLLQEILIDVFPEYDGETNKFADPSTPQAKAFHWILNHDTYYDQLDIDVTSDGKYQSAIIQRYVLAVLFFSTEGFINYNLASAFTPDANREKIWTTEGGLNFLSNRHECEWFSLVNGIKYGVARCGIDFKVKELYLKRLGLRGYLPPEIRLLQDLERFNLSYNYLSGTIPEMDGMNQLRLLDLSHNTFVGKLPESVGNLMSLQGLRIHSNRIVGTEAIPASVCQLVSENLPLVDFWADCRSQIDPVRCECCSVCCDGHGGGCLTEAYDEVDEDHLIVDLWFND